MDRKSFKGWCISFRGPKIYFEECKEPEDSGITITDKRARALSTLALTLGVSLIY